MTDIIILPVAGTHLRKEAIKLIAVGNRCYLEPEPSNEYDRNAIKVMYNGIQFGYIPRTHNRAVLDAIAIGCTINVAISSITKLANSNIEVMIELGIEYPDID